MVPLHYKALFLVWNILYPDLKQMEVSLPTFPLSSLCVPCLCYSSLTHISNLNIFGLLWQCPQWAIIILHLNPHLETRANHTALQMCEDTPHLLRCLTPVPPDPLTEANSRFSKADWLTSTPPTLTNERQEGLMKKGPFLLPKTRFVKPKWKAKKKKYLSCLPKKKHKGNLRIAYLFTRSTIRYLRLKNYSKANWQACQQMDCFEKNNANTLSCKIIFWRTGCNSVRQTTVSVYVSSFLCFHWDFLLLPAMFFFLLNLDTGEAPCWHCGEQNRPAECMRAQCSISP